MTSSPHHHRHRHHPPHHHAHRDTPQDMNAPVDSSTWRINMAVLIAGLTMASGLYATQPLLPQFVTEFGVTPAISSFALSISTGFLAASAFLMGPVSDNFGRRYLMFLSLVGAAICGLLSAIAPSWDLLLVTRAFEGIILGGIPVIAMAYLAEEVPSEKIGLAIGLYVGGTAAGGLIGRAGMGIITDIFSWRHALGAVSAVNFLLALIFILLLPPSRHFIRKHSTAHAHIKAWLGHLRDPVMHWIFIIGFLALGTLVATYNYIGFHLLKPPYNLTNAQISLIFLAYGFGILASFAAGGLSDRFGWRAVIIGGALICLMGLILTLFTPLGLIFTGISILTIGFFFVHSAASGAVSRMATRDKSHASSLYLLSYYLGSSFAGSLAGLFWTLDAWHGVAIFCSVLIGAILLIALRLPSRAHPEK